MSTRKFLGALSALVLFSMLLVACGQAPSAPSAAATAAAVAPTAAAAAAAAGQAAATAGAAAGQVAGTAAAIAPSAAAVAGQAAGTAVAAAGGAADKVALQLKWVAQAQFAGYYAALEQGYYTAENLDVTIKSGGPDIVPEQIVASGQAEFGIDWLASLLATREQGTPLVNIAQVFTYAGMRQLSWKETNIASPADLKGKKVAVWFGGNEYNLLATLAKYKLDKEKDLTLVQQPFDMNLLLNKEVDSAAAMTYNELYQVLSAGHKIDELNIIDYNKEGTAMPEDGIFVSEEWLSKDPGNKEIAARFLRASFKGWEFCRDNAATCVDYVLKQDQGGVMTREAQQWQMDEINKLIWGDPVNKATKIGYMEPELFKRGAETALTFGVIKNPADETAYTHEIWKLATGQ